MTEVVEVDIHSLVADPYNANRGTDRGREALQRSLENHGAARSILLGNDGKTILAGNKTVEAARRAGIEKVIVVRSRGEALVAHEREDLDPESLEARAVGIKDNRIAEIDLSWDTERILEAQRAGVDLSALYSAVELDDLRASLVMPSGLVEGADPDAIPEAVEPRCKRGEVWALGRHRLMCGDSTDADDVEHLMGGKEADLCFTSPPYDQQRDYTNGAGDWLPLMQGVFGVLPTSARAQVLVNLGLVHRDGEWRPYWDPWVAWMRAEGWRSFGWYVWDQGSGLPGEHHGRLAPSHEFIFHFNRLPSRDRQVKPCITAGTIPARRKPNQRDPDGNARAWCHGDSPTQDTRVPDSVFRVARHSGGVAPAGHPAVFPVALVTEVAEAFSDPGDGLYDPFSGSGAAFIACEAIGRTCFGMDIAPEYCSLTVARFEQTTGQAATRL